MELTLISKNKLGKSQYKYIFVEKDSNTKLIWNTKKEYWFDKHKYFLAKYSIYSKLEDGLEIKNLRFIRWMEKNC